jgi:hypothetical protein
MTWIDATVGNGGKVWVTRRHAAVLDTQGRSHGPVPLVRWYRYVRPADVPRLPPGTMLVADRMTETAARELTGQNWWATTVDGRYSIAEMRGDPERSPDPIARRRPAPLEVQLTGLMMAAPDQPHRFYAAALGISRARVTQLFAALDGAGERLEAHQLLTRWVAADPRTTGHVTRWKGAGSAWEQAGEAYRWLDEQRCEPVLGGEVAADAHRPWRSPGSSVLHVRKLTPPPPGFVVADSPATATVTVVVDTTPAVPAVAAELDTPIGRVLLAHPVHVAQDLADAAAHDERAAEHRELLISRDLVTVP